MAQFVKLQRINLSYVAFLAPFIVRLLPELLMGVYITGFDTISYYVPVTLKWINCGVGFWEFLGTAPVFYVLLYGLTSTGVPLIVSLKVFPPILHGLLGFVIFKYAIKSLEWSPRKALLTSLLATLYFVGLRISWDMLRSELDLIFLFALLIILRKCLSDFSWRQFSVLAFSAVMIVLTHQLISVIMFTFVFGIILDRLTKWDYSSAKRILVAFLPAIALFIFTFMFVPLSLTIRPVSNK